MGDESDGLPVPSLNAAIEFLKTAKAQAIDLENQSFEIQRKISQLTTNVALCSEVLLHHSAVNTDSVNWYKKDSENPSLERICRIPIRALSTLVTKLKLFRNSSKS